jgi:hypothetical protein
MACPLCGDPCTCSGGERTTVLIDPDQPCGFHPSPPRIAVGQAAAPRFDPAPVSHDWRSEISTRVRAHRRRCGIALDPSLDLDFPEAPGEVPLEVVRPEPALDEAESRYARMARRAATRRAAGSPPDPAPGVVIEFPKAATLDLFPAAPDAMDELAEALPAVPRILEAPEPEPEPPVVPVLSGLHLDPIAAEEQSFETVDLELPLQVAPLGPRFMSALIDTVMALTAFALFAVIVMSSVQYVPQGKMALLWAVAGPVVFWAAYHYLFLVFGDATPGMVMSQLELSTFDGCFPPRRLRAHRAAALLLSCASLGLGFLWSAFDVDALGWHDRMTRTYLRQS